MFQILFFNLYYVAAQTILELSVNQGENYIAQTTFNQMFKLIINQNYDYIMIEITMQNQNYHNLMLVYQQIADMDNQPFTQMVYEKIDNNGYALQKSYQYLLINNDEIDITKKQYINVFSTPTVTYRISATGYTNFKPCPLRCNNQGSCFQGKCLCNEGWIDEDCSIQATKIQIGSNLKIQNNSYNISYLYYESTSDSQSFYLTFEANSESNIQINMLIADFIYLPTEKYSDQILILNSSSSSAQIAFNQKNLNKRLLEQDFFKPSLLVISLQNTNNSLINDTIQISLNHIEEEKSISIIVIVVPIVTGIFAIGLCFYCARTIRNKLKSKKQAIITQRLEQDQMKDLIIVGEKIQEFIPIMVKNIPQKIADDQCSICLENWNKDSAKQTPCGHIFHNNCIKMWLEKHSHCPLCRANLMIQDLTEAKQKKLHIQNRLN